MTTWAAPHISAPFSATVSLPGSKSITNRALILAALADGPSLLHGVLRSRDTDLMMSGLASIGIGIDVDAHDPTTVTVTPNAIHGGRIDCGLAGTVMRFVPPLAALGNADIVIGGDEQMRARPIDTIVRALRDLGVTVDNDSLPFTVTGGNARGGPVTIDASGSSQFVSGLLLSAPRFRDGITISHVGEQIPSQPHIDMTIAMLAESGVTVDTSTANTWRVAPGPIAAYDRIIEPDLSNAAAFLAAAAAGGSVSVPHWPTRTTQPGFAITDVLASMGVEINLADHVVTARGTGTLTGITADLRDIGELTPTIAALCALATTPSTLSGIAHLRGHETNRLAALTTEINRLGGNCTETSDGLHIEPAELHGGRWQSYADHRMATAGALIGLAIPDVEVDDIECTSKTLPNFPGMWQSMFTEAVSL